MKWWHKLLIILAAVLIVAFMGISIFLGFSMTSVVRVPVEENPADLGLMYENISFQSREDALTMRGWLLPAADNGKIIIMVHGGEMHRADPSINMLGIAAELVNHDFNVLMFDLRSHGESDGSKLSAGYYEKRDLLGAIDFVKGRGFDKIGVLGFSMGAATSILATAENNDIRCIVSDSCFADITDLVKSQFSARTRFPGFFLRPMLFMVRIFFGVDFYAGKPIDAVAKIAPRPIFFIHGAGDTFLPADHAQRLLDASHNPDNTLWIAPNAEHVQSYISNRTEYIERITTFFNANLE